MSNPLSGTRVLDVSRLLPGPFCAMILADLGADVIKVESTMLGDPMRAVPPQIGTDSWYFLSINRNKRSLAINLRRQDGREVFRRLVRTADVMIESYCPGQAESLGIGYDDLKPLNPGLVYCSISGFGQQGPFRDRPGHDLSYAALSGLLDLIGTPTGEVFVPALPVADVSSALFAAIGILSALMARRENGAGCQIDTSIFHSALSVAAFPASTQMSTQAPKERGQRYLLGEHPSYHVYRTKDGRYMALAALEPVLWADFCQAIDREDLIPKHQSSSEHSAVMAELQRIFAQRTQVEWVEFLRDKPVSCEPVNTVDEALSSPPLQHYGTMPVEHSVAGSMEQFALPFGLLGNHRQTASPPPLLGQHTVEILESLGYDVVEIEHLRARRVVSTAQDIAARRNKTQDPTA